MCANFLYISDLIKTLMKTKHANLLVLLLLIMILPSCRNNADVERAFETFLMFLVQIITFVLFGISSIVLSIISSLGSTKSSTPKIIGIILVTIFALITAICLMITVEINPKRNYIFFAFVVDAMAIFLSVFFLFKPKGESAQISAQNYSTAQLDKIIEIKPEPAKKSITNVNSDGLEQIDDLD